jgi:hypothetical protein
MKSSFQSKKDKEALENSTGLVEKVTKKEVI